MNHHPAIFPAPEKFDPDRWYVDSPLVCIAAQPVFFGFFHA